MRRINYKLLINILILVILSACQPPAPTPQPTRQPESITASSAYLPIIGISTPSDKAAIALAHYERGIPHELLGVDKDVYYHTWGMVGGRTPDGNELTVVWCDALGNNDYETSFADVVASGNVSDYVMFANEPDRPDQCNASIERIAQSYLNLVAICPECWFVGPMYSTADNGNKVALWFEAVYDLCGRPCPALDRLYALSLHIYTRGSQDKNNPGWTNYPPSERVTELCAIVDGGECKRPVWITEVGWEDSWNGERAGFSEWIRDMEQDERIERYFVYSVWQRPGGQFLPLVSWEGDRLTALGYGFRLGVYR